MLQIIHKNKIYMLGKFTEITEQLKQLSADYAYVKDLLSAEALKMKN